MSRLPELRGLIERHLDGDAPPVLAGLQLFSTDTVTGPTSSIAEASLAFVAQGEKQVAIGGHVLGYGAGDYLVVTVDLPVTGRFTKATRTEPFLGIGLTLDPEAVASLLLEVPEAGARPGGRSGPALGVAHASEDLLDALCRLVRLLETPEDQQVLAPLVQREILWRLLQGPQGELVRQVGLQGGLRQVGQVVRWIRDHYAEPFRVDRLAARASMSPSTFHRHFRAATTMGPVQFQKKIRLQQARLMLTAGTSGTVDVTGVAMAVGYESPSQFSREYRREWGLSPGQDLRRRPA